MLEYVSQDGPCARSCSTACRRRPGLGRGSGWSNCCAEQNVSQHPSVVRLARVILALAAQGGVVLIGRGAGLLLPAETTLHVRVWRRWPTASPTWASGCA